MKVAVIDDEETIREGIRAFVADCNPGYEVRAYQNAESALGAFREFMPELVITDIVMPGMSGIDLVSALRESSDTVRIILVSGYSDISYLKSAVQHSAVDYIFKPIDTEKLQTAIERAAEQLRREKDEDSQKQLLISHLNRSMPLLFEKLLSDLIDGRLLSKENIKERMQLSGIQYADGTRYLLVCMLAQAGAKGTSIPETCAGISAGYKGIHTKVLYSFARSESELIAILSTDASSGQEAIYSDVVESISCLRLAAGISSIFHDFSDIGEAYRQAFSAASRFGLLGQTGAILFRELHGSPSPVFSISESLEREIILALCTGSEATLSIFMDHIFEGFQEGGLEDKELEALKLEVIAFLVRLIRQFDTEADELFYAENFNWNECLSLSSPQEIRQWLTYRLLHACRLTLQSSNSKTGIFVNMAKQIINTRYSDPINVQSVADELKISCNYLSAIFKHATGQNFTDYLTRKRLAEARRMLADPTAKIGEVCARAGYEDQNYFAKVFKKHFGLSPSAYLKLHGS